MIKTILGETFEQLGEIPKQVVKQTAKLPGDIAHSAVRSVIGAKSDSGTQKRIDPLTGIELPSQSKIRRLKKQEKRMKAAAISHAREIIHGVEKPRPAVPTKPAELPAYLGGKPGMTEEKLAQMQGLKPTKQELPPPVSAAKPKFGTSERKLGVSG